jgi:hypothetical protein
MQDHRICGDQLFPLESVNQEIRHGGKIKARELFIDEIKPFYRAAVVVLIVADDQLFLHSLDAGRITSKLFHGVDGHIALLWLVDFISLLAASGA